MFKDYMGKDNNSPPKSKELRSYLSLAAAVGIPYHHCSRRLPKILLAKFSLNGLEEHVLKILAYSSNCRLKLLSKFDKHRCFERSSCFRYKSMFKIAQ